MSEALTATIRSLSAIIEEETALLEDGRWPPDHGALAAAKLKLVGALEAQVAERQRLEPDWPGPAEPASDGLAAAVADLRDRAAANAAVLARQIALSHDLLQAIGREAQRLGGQRQQTYRRGGTLDQRNGPAPVAINTRL